VLFAMANAGLPATSGFVGEFLVILGALKVSFWYAIAAGTTLILGAAYSLWMVRRVLYGEIANPNVAALKDVNARELTFLVLLAIGVLGLGIYPRPLSDVMVPTVMQLLDHVTTSKL